MQCLLGATSGLGGEKFGHQSSCPRTRIGEPPSLTMSTQEVMVAALRACLQELGALRDGDATVPVGAALPHGSDEPLSEELVALLQDARDMKWPFVPERWQYVNPARHEDTRDLKDILAGQLPQLLGALWRAVAEDDTLGAACACLALDRSAYWADASGPLLRVVRALHRRSPDTPLAPQIVIRQARVYVNDGQLRKAEYMLNNLIENNGQTGTWVYHSDQDRILVQSVCIQIRGQIFQKLGMWLEAADLFLLSIVGFQNLDIADKKGISSSLGLLAEVLVSMSDSDYEQLKANTKNVPASVWKQPHRLLAAAEAAKLSAVFVEYVAGLVLLNMNRCGTCLLSYSQLPRVPDDARRARASAAAAAFEVCLLTRRGRGAVTGRTPLHAFIYAAFNLSVARRLARPPGLPAGGRVSAGLSAHACARLLRLLGTAEAAARPGRRGPAAASAAAAEEEIDRAVLELLEEADAGSENRTEDPDSFVPDRYKDAEAYEALGRTEEFAAALRAKASSLFRTLEQGEDFRRPSDSRDGGAAAALCITTATTEACATGDQDARGCAKKPIASLVGYAARDARSGSDGGSSGRSSRGEGVSGASKSRSQSSTGSWGVVQKSGKQWSLESLPEHRPAAPSLAASDSSGSFVFVEKGGGDAGGDAGAGKPSAAAVKEATEMVGGLRVSPEGWASSAEVVDAALATAGSEEPGHASVEAAGRDRREMAAPDPDGTVDPDLATEDVFVVDVLARDGAGRRAPPKSAAAAATVDAEAPTADDGDPVAAPRPQRGSAPGELGGRGSSARDVDPPTEDVPSTADGNRRLPPSPPSPASSERSGSFDLLDLDAETNEGDGSNLPPPPPLTRGRPAALAGGASAPDDEPPPGAATDVDVDLPTAEDEAVAPRGAEARRRASPAASPDSGSSFEVATSDATTDPPTEGPGGRGGGGSAEPSSGSFEGFPPGDAPSAANAVDSTARRAAFRASRTFHDKPGRSGSSGSSGSSFETVDYSFVDDGQGRSMLPEEAVRAEGELSPMDMTTAELKKMLEGKGPMPLVEENTVHLAMVLTYNRSADRWAGHHTLLHIGARLQLTANVRGQQRDAFWVQYLHQEQALARYVGKCYKREREARYYVDNVVRQATAQHYVTEFNQRLFKKKHPTQIYYMPATLLLMLDDGGRVRACMNAEPYMEGSFAKITNNSEVYKRNVPAAPYAIAFSHFTYDLSKGSEIIVDLQGWTTMDGTGLMYLTDPLVHSWFKDLNDSVDYGQRGFHKFWDKQHAECNHICHDLDLKRPPPGQYTMNS
uniref:Alpha-protein kinase 1 isoform X1 n=2 Tax=Petromyzon marinus TaxID=7757 RepID=A0AAJ7X8A4_PETMA|nr:alpha-protein kinase 1 isoform X1 [Petromyzon marinus]